MKKSGTVYLIALAVIFIAGSCSQAGNKGEKVTRVVSGTFKDKDVYTYTLTNKQGNVLRLSDFGARIVWIEVPDRNGVKENVTFGFDTFEGMIKGDPYFGAVVGRYANRIAKGKFTLDGVEYNLPINNGVNSLHGGPGGWHSAVWNSEIVADAEFPSVKFSLHSPDMEEGYPGNMDVEVVYTWTDNNEIILDYSCTTDKKTVVNITNHAYFNLHGAGSGDILDHELMIRGSGFVAVDSTLIPTGEIRPVAGTPFDFTSPRTVGSRIGEDYDQLKRGNGYDHTYVLDNTEEIGATVYEPVSGRLMEMITDQPGVQFYCGNFLNGSRIGYGGKPYTFRSGLCLETGHYPDSPNQPGFPSTVLNPGEKFSSTTIYRFSVK